MCKSQPTDEKLSQIGAWSGHVTVTRYEILGIQLYVVCSDIPVPWRIYCFVDQCVMLSRHAYVKVLLMTYLLPECVMVKDGLAKLPDCFTVGDMSDIASYLCTC